MKKAPVPASDPVSDTRVALRGAYSEKDQITTRRRIAGYLYFIKRWSQPKIVDYLTNKHEPRIPCILSTICRDIDVVRGMFRRRYNARGFDPLVEVGTRVERYEMAAALAWREAETATDRHEKLLALRVYREMNREATTLLQDVGLLDRHIGKLTFGTDDADSKATRIPGAAEFQKRYETIVVLDGELVSEAERAQRYGDAQAAEAAALEADHAG